MWISRPSNQLLTSAEHPALVRLAFWHPLARSFEVADSSLSLDNLVDVAAAYANGDVILRHLARPDAPAFLPPVGRTH